MPHVVASKVMVIGGSNHISDVAWYDRNSERKTYPVGTKQVNELGLYDMSGNVCEWCQDWYGSYSNSSQTNPAGVFSGSRRVGRGGCWGYYEWYCRLSYRCSYPSDFRNYDLGFRLVLSE